jgi:hypothetical protein
MNSILKLIIVPFKLPKWIISSDVKIMDNPHPFTKQFVMRYYCQFDWISICIHPIMAEVILKNKSELKPTLFANPSPLLTELIIEKFELTLGNLYWLTTNINPKLAKFIISHRNNFDAKCWNNIMKNPNPELTEFIKNFYQVCADRSFINSNTNPELAELILSISAFTDTFYMNPSPGLTDFLVKYPRLLSNNTNPDLAPIIIKVNGEKYKQVIYKNSNIGLTDFIINNPPQNNYERCLLMDNRNPKLAKLIYDNKRRIEGDWNYLGINKYIFEPVKLKL